MEATAVPTDPDDEPLPEPHDGMAPEEKGELLINVARNPEAAITRLAKIREENPLAHLLVVALTGMRMWDAHVGEDGIALGPGWWCRLPNVGVERGQFPVSSGRSVYPSLEIVGTAGVADHYVRDPRHRAVFANDLAWQVHGIDLVVEDVERGGYVLVEAKGTSKAIGGPSGYLRRTRTKGRQLSWNWCWHSLVDMAEYPHMARAFVELHRPLIRGELRRALGVSRAQRADGGWVVAETQVWEEAELGRDMTWMRERLSNRNLVPWLDEIDTVLA